MSTEGNKANVPVTLTTRLVEGSDNAKTSVFTSGTGVGLERRRVETSNLAKISFQLLDDGLVPLNLVLRSEWVNIAELRPGQRNHAAGAIELHRAATQRDHGVDKTEVLGGQVVNVSEHLGLGVVLVEDRVGQDFGGALQVGSDSGPGGFCQVGKCDERLVGCSRENVDQIDQLLRCNTFVESDPDAALVDLSKVDSSSDGGGVDSLGAGDGASDIKSKGIEVGGIESFEAERLDRGLENLCEAVDFVGDAMKAVWSVIYRVHGSHVSKERLCGADVAGSLFTTNMLLTSCKNSEDEEERN